MRLPRLRTFAEGVVTVCLLYLVLQVLVETRWKNRSPTDSPTGATNQRRIPMLGIVVPLRTEELDRAVDSLSRWPRRCSDSTLHRVDVILYFAEQVPQDSEKLLRVARESTSCFRTTRVVSAGLRNEENSVDMVRSAQFYRLFLAPGVRASFAAYDALAIMEWDIIIAQETSFEVLYSTAFTGSEPFWVKGSRLATTDFDERAASPEMWHLADHLDANAIYNNTDIEFVDFVNFTLDRWNSTRPYEVALWATVSEYPYSWPLWQRYASKFVATSMVSTLEFRDVEGEDELVPNVIDQEALFLCRRAKHIGKGSSTFGRQIRGCHEACGSGGNPAEDAVLSTVCDATCMNESSWIGLRFNGYNCGAGEPSKYGESCRLCFTDQHAALNAEQELAASIENSTTPQDHVIMCKTKLPPEAIDCHFECRDNINTICDRRCGTGRYGDWYCDWQRLDKKCRFCFRDIVEARRADKIAREAGGRVIMCETHEPPPERNDLERIAGIPNLVQYGEEIESARSNFSDVTDPKEPSPSGDPAVTPFVGNITHGNICVFIPGYFAFFHETKLAVETVLSFMPGVKVVIPTHPMEHHAFRRALGEQNTAISIFNATRVDYASLVADKACGHEVRLIYYMNPGDVLSRTFTAKDTHSSKGALLVQHTDAEVAGGEFVRRSMGTSALLGFYGLTLTYGTDLILPVEINAQLREVLSAARTKEFGSMEKSVFCPQEDSFGSCVFHEYLDSLSRTHASYATIFIPELLAALLYLRSPRRVQFFDPRDRGRNISGEPTIWDVPLLRPRFGCSIDLTLSLQGYDVAHQLSNHIDEFKNGAQCKHGFVAVDPGTLKLKAGWEFPKGYPISSMPPLRDFRVSIMYRTFSGDADIFKMSLPTAIEHIPDALEIVVVVEEVDKELFEQLVAPYRESAPFPLRVVAESSLMDGHIQQKYSKMRADLYTKGDYILHLDSDVLVLHDITYEHIFHLGKPVLPFRRYRDDSEDGRHLILCWQIGTSEVMKTDVLHEFSIFNTHVYPRKMYPAMRELLETLHGKSFVDFMSTRLGKCVDSKNREWSIDRQHHRLSDFNVMGAFLWYHMRDAVYWMAADPYDLDPDQYRVDLRKFQWICQANGRCLPEDKEGKDRFRDDFMSVTNTEECDSVVQKWTEVSKGFFC